GLIDDCRPINAELPRSVGRRLSLSLIMTIPNDEQLSRRYRPMRCRNPACSWHRQGLVEPLAKSGWFFAFSSLKGHLVRPTKDSTRLPATHRLVCVPLTKKSNRTGVLCVAQFAL